MDVVEDMDHVFNVNDTEDKTEDKTNDDSNKKHHYSEDGGYSQ